MSSPRQPHLPTSKKDKDKIQRLYAHLSSTNSDNDCWFVEHLVIPGIYANRDYPSTKITVGNSRKDQRLSRLFYALYEGPIPDGFLIRHRCDNTKCIRPEHLIPRTAKDNGRDKKNRNRAKGINAGESNSNSKLTADIVLNTILPMLELGKSVKEIALTVGITPPMISYIKNGHSWSELTGINPKPRKSRQSHKKREAYDRNRPFTDEFMDIFRDSIRVEEKVTSEDVLTPCHIFIGGDKKTARGRITAEGYGAIRWEGAYRLAHHVSFRILHARWPKPNYDISHKCRNKLCVNPEHLDEMTRKEHMFYAATRGWLSQGHIGNRGNQRLTDDQIRQIKEIYRDEPKLADQEIVERLQLPVGAPALARIRKSETGTHVIVEGFVPRKKKGAAARGQRSGRSKLKPEQIHEIRRRGDAGEKAIALAEEFNVSRRTVDDIVARRTWKNLPEEKVAL